MGEDRKEDKDDDDDDDDDEVDGEIGDRPFGEDNDVDVVPFSSPLLDSSFVRMPTRESC